MTSFINTDPVQVLSTVDALEVGAYFLYDSGKLYMKTTIDRVRCLENGNENAVGEFAGALVPVRQLDIVQHSALAQ